MKIFLKIYRYYKFFIKPYNKIQICNFLSWFHIYNWYTLYIVCRFDRDVCQYMFLSSCILRKQLKISSCSIWKMNKKCKKKKSHLGFLFLKRRSHLICMVIIKRFSHCKCLQKWLKVCFHLYQFLLII